MSMGTDARTGGISTAPDEHAAERMRRHAQHPVPGGYCAHPELMPMHWGQARPAPAAYVGTCVHNYVCPVCGFGAASMPDPCDPSPHVRRSNV